MADEIEIREMRFRCSAEPAHRWAETWAMPMTLKNFARRMSAASECPSCGAIVLLGWPEAAPNAEEEPLPCG